MSFYIYKLSESRDLITLKNVINRYLINLNLINRYLINRYLMSKFKLNVSSIHID